MKQSITLFFVIVCTVVLAAQQSQAKKGCNAYGHACYGGHGKRSLGTVEEEVRPEVINAMFPSEEGPDMIEPYRRYRLLKIMNQLFGGRSKFSTDRFSDADYSSNELFRENSVN